MLVINLIGGLEQFLFSTIYGIILPIDFHIFQDVYIGYIHQSSFNNVWFFLVLLRRCCQALADSVSDVFSLTNWWSSVLCSKHFWDQEF